MKKYYADRQLCFDDILLVPQHSDIESRKSVDLHTSIGACGETSYTMSIPIVAAPMDTVCEWEMAAALRKMGSLGIIHRYMSIEDQVFQVKMMQGHNLAAGYSVGATGDFMERSWALVESGAAFLLVDIANGHSQHAIKAVKELRSVFGKKIHIMAGNVATYDGFARLADVGADSVRVGIGGGSVCTTRVITGHGIPTLASVMEIAENNKYSTSIVADGGIRNSGDAAKALAAGANAVMLGSYLAGSTEAPGEVYTDDSGNMYKVFRGMASREAQYDGRGQISVVEGVTTKVAYKGDVESLVGEFVGGLRSALSYTGVSNLKDFRREAMYAEVSTLTRGESKPHA